MENRHWRPELKGADIFPILRQQRSVEMLTVVFSISIQCGGIAKKIQAIVLLSSVCNFKNMFTVILL